MGSAVWHLRARGGAGALRATDQYQHLQPAADCLRRVGAIVQRLFSGAITSTAGAVVVPAAPQSAGARRFDLAAGLLLDNPHLDRFFEHG